MNIGQSSVQYSLLQQDLSFLVGVDEAGRGPLAGPVVAAAVILDPGKPIDGLADSKKLSPARRQQLRAEIVGKARAWRVAWADVPEIDTLNILQASMLAMRRAVAGLTLCPSMVQVDGNRLPPIRWSGELLPGEAIVGGDDSVDAISAASILAKEQRDEFMKGLDGVYPGYEFARHKGYGTARHLENLRKLGACPQHRRSFRPVSAIE